MKKTIIIFLLVSLGLIFCTACEKEDSYNNGYEVGYDIGILDGWESGEEYTKRDISIMYEECIDSPEMEDAAETLWCYVYRNSGEEISEEDLREATLKMLEYYNAVEDYHYHIKTKNMFDVMDIYY